MPVEIKLHSTMPTKNNILIPKFMPSTAWFSNLRSELSVKEWKSVQQKTFELSGYVCDACGGRGDEHPVECHEEWDFDDVTLIQRLVKTVSLCPNCHTATHFGLARVRGVDRIALQHVMKVNNWSIEMAVESLKKQSALGESRSQYQWVLDARWLLDFIELSETTKNKILAHAKDIRERTIKDWQKEIVRNNTVNSITADDLFELVKIKIHNNNYISIYRNFTDENECDSYLFKGNELMCKWSGLDRNGAQIHFLTINYLVIDDMVNNILHANKAEISSNNLKVVINKCVDFVIEFY